MDIKTGGWLILDSSESGMGSTEKQLAIAFQEAGVECNVVLTKSMPEAELEKILNAYQPSVIAWVGVEQWNYYELLCRVSSKKVNLWFDDPELRVEAHKCSDKVRHAALRPDFKFYIWDQYWLNKAQKLWGVKGEILHLAANPRDFYETDTELSEDAVFIGTLHSQKAIEGRKERLNPILRKVVNSASYYSAPWDQNIDSAVKELSDGDRRLFRDQCEILPNLVSDMRWCVWAASKNLNRRCYIGGALKVTPVTVFTETKSLDHAGVDELRSMFNCWSSRLKIIDCSGYSIEKLGQLYHYGSIHIGATDSQSVDTGIPYRVFQTMASGRALLTDVKPGWEKVVEVGKEILSYQGSIDFEEKLSLWLKNKDGLKEVGAAARKRFEKEHTWAHRVKQLLKC